MAAGLGLLLVVPTPALAKPPRPATKESPADELAREATRRFKEGELEIAAQLFMKAYGLDKRPDRVFNAARAYEKAGLAEQAIPLFRLYMQITDDTAGREEARLRIEALQADLRRKERPAEPGPKPAEPQAEPTPEPRPEPTPQPQPQPTPTPPEPGVRAPVEPSRWPAYTLLGGGTVAGLAGLGLFLAVLSDEEALREELTETDAKGHVDGVTERQAAERRADHGTQRTMAAVLGGVGLAALGAGAWLMLAPKSRVAVVPAGQGVVARVEF